jgi:hypothetical protein
MPDPTSLEQALEQRQALMLEIQSIQSQLGDRQRTDKDGGRLTAEDYWAWRRQAVHALNLKLDEARSIKAWIRNNRGAPDGVSAPIHVHRLYRILCVLKTEDVDLDSAELNQMTAAAAFLRQLGIDPEAPSL